MEDMAQLIKATSRKDWDGSWLILMHGRTHLRTHFVNIRPKTMTAYLGGIIYIWHLFLQNCSCVGYSGECVKKESHQFLPNMLTCI